MYLGPIPRSTMSSNRPHYLLMDERKNQMSDYDVPEEKKRAGNADRDRYIDHLASAVSTGHLSEEEFTERRDKALTARIKDDLMVLVKDLPPVPEPERKTHMVQYQLVGTWLFSPWRWGAALILSSALIVLPGPLCAAIYHGFDNAPLQGAMPVLLILAGVFSLLIGGIAWSPDAKHEEGVE